MSKRMGYCEYCSVPLMEDDHHCVGCGAPAVVLLEIEYEQPYCVDGGVPPNNFDVLCPPPPTLYAEWL